MRRAVPDEGYRDDEDEANGVKVVDCHEDKGDVGKNSAENAVGELQGETDQEKKERKLFTCKGNEVKYEKLGEVKIVYEYNTLRFMSMHNHSFPHTGTHTHISNIFYFFQFADTLSMVPDFCPIIFVTSTRVSQKESI